MTTLGAATVPYARPPSADRLGAGLLLAVLVHVGLLAGLASGVSWRRHNVPVVSAELWAAVPRVAGAAPAPDVAPPPPPPQAVAPAPPPKPVAAPPPPPPAAALREAQIATEQRKAAERKALEREQAAKLAREQEAARQRAAAEKLAREKALRDKQAADKAAADKKLADKKAAEKLAADKLEKAEAERLQRLREANLARMRKELTAAPPNTSGSGTALPQPGRGSAATPGTGTAAQSAAPSAGYEGRIRARILPNIIYNGPKSGTPAAEVVVSVAPDGRIISSRLLKSSGVPEWDREVLRAIERTEVLPRDVDGRVPPQIILAMEPSER